MDLTPAIIIQILVLIWIASASGFRLEEKGKKTNEQPQLDDPSLELLETYAFIIILLGILLLNSLLTLNSNCKPPKGFE